jgi:transcriptional regulator with XRE-family HTH domain
MAQGLSLGRGRWGQVLRDGPWQAFVRVRQIRYICSVTPGQLLRDARRRHRVTQQQLAARARTSQAAISRIERGVVSPSVATLTHLLDLLGEELELDAKRMDWGHDVTLIESKLDRTPAQRVADTVAFAHFVRSARAT